jgi:hypothetical protein
MSRKLISTMLSGKVVYSDKALGARGAENVLGLAWHSGGMTADLATGFGITHTVWLLRISNNSPGQKRIGTAEVRIIGVIGWLAPFHNQTHSTVIG